MSGENRFLILPKLVVGLAMVAFGAILLGDNLHLIDADAILRWFWPATFFALGLAMLARGARCGGFFWGFVWLGVGTVLLLHRLGYHFAFDLWDLFWPVVLLIAGGHLVRRALSGPRPAAGGELGDTVNTFALLSGSNLRSHSERFRGGDVSAFMGGCKLDLLEAKPVPEGAVIDAFAMWGAVEIRVPEGWQVTSQVTPVLGGYVDKTQAPVGEPAGRLTVRGLAMMGGIGVTN